MNSKLPWDDLRVVLAVAEAGSLAGAGRRLGASHATVFRRLGDVERRLGVRLFERSRLGYAPTDAGEELAEAARRIEAEVHDAERRIVGRDLRPAGVVRVTTTDSLMVGLVSPILAAFRRLYPGIVLEVVVSNQVFSLSRREADVAIRSSSAPPETLVGRRVATIAQAVYDRRRTAGGVIGAQIGAKAGARLHGEHLRVLLAIMVLIVCAKLGYDLTATPEDLYSLSAGGHS